MGRKHRKAKRDTSAPAYGLKSQSGDNEYDSEDAESFANSVAFEDDASTVSSDLCFELTDIAMCMNRLDMHVDQLLDRREVVQAAGVNGIIQILRKYFVGEELLKWKSSIVDYANKLFKKGFEKGILATQLIALISVQLGCSEDLDKDFDRAISFMRKASADNSETELFRVQCIISLTVCSLLILVEPSSIEKSQETLRNVWSNMKSNTLLISLYCAALENWILLVGHGGQSSLMAALLDQPKLIQFVDSAQAKMRISSGECIATLHEMAVATYGSRYRFPNHATVLEKFALLSKSSEKFVGKKDRRSQKTSFRQLYAHFVDKGSPLFSVKFGRETLNLCSCEKKLWYDTCCQLLRDGMNSHLTLNPILRKSFNLEEIAYQSTRLRKTKRVAMYKAADKLKSIERGKDRDERLR